MSLLQKLFQKYLRKFFLTEGRGPGTPREWMDVQDDAVRELNKTKGAPKKEVPPFQGWNPKIVKKGGIEELLEGPVTSTGPKGTRTWDFSKPKKKGEVIDFPKKKASGGRIGMAGGGALFKFIEKLFIKASNDIRLGKGKWKGLQPKQIAIQHDNLTKKVTEFQKTGKLPEGTEQYFDVNPEKVFKEAQAKVKKTAPKVSGDEYLEALDKRIMDEMDITKSEMDNMSSTALDDLRRNADPIGMEQNLGEITPGRGVGDFADDPNFLKDVAPVKTKKTRTMDDLVDQAYDEIAGGSGFSGDIKYDADILASEIATTGGKIYDDLADVERMGIYDLAYSRMAKNLKAKMDFKKGLKDVEQKVELQMFDPKDRKPNASGGRVPLMYGGDPGFQFEYGGSWADWRDQHQHQMPITDYIKTRLPKERLPFRDMQSGGLAYMLGEPTYMKYGAGGGVGHAPWHKPSGQQPQPQGQPQPGGAPGGGRPDPMKAPRGLPSLAPRTMDPAVMQQQAMQKMMMGQGQPRMGMEEGGDVYGPPPPKKEKKKKKEKEKRTPDPDPDKLRDPFWRWDIRLPAEEKPGTRVDPREGIGFSSFGDIDVDMSDPRFKLGKYDPEEDYFPWEFEVGKDSAGIRWRKRFNQGGRMALGLGSMSRRAFLKMMAAGAALPFIGKGISKVAPKAIPKVTETIVKGADGMPAYLSDLIGVVKAKGTKDFIEGFKKSDYSTVHSYKGVDVVEDAAGNTKIKKGTETSVYGSNEPGYYENHIEITKGDYVKNKQGKMVKEGDEYFEGTVRPDRDGKMKDIIEEIDEVDHLKLKKIADEIDTLEIEGYDRFSKASGGLAYALGE